MSMTVVCPGCAAHLAFAPELLGQVLVCPHCSNQFRATAGPHADPPAPQQSPAAPAPVWRGDPGALAAGFKLEEPAAASAPQHAAVPRFKPIDTPAPAVSLTQEGTLPELSLAEPHCATPKTVAQSEKQPQPLALTLIVAASLTLSACLSLMDFSPEAGGADARQQARRRIASFYQRSEGPLQRYQLLLRDAQRAHSRGDDPAERTRYREVLRLLRAENRSTSLTETREGDQRLEADIAVALGGD